MLTQDQINRLNPLCDHPKYGRIVQHAMNNWRGDANPNSGAFGIGSSESNIFEPILNNNSCCLIGAALIGQVEIEYSIIRTAMLFFQLSYEEFRSLWHGFDNYHENDCDQEVFAFGLAVRNALGL